MYIPSAGLLPRARPRTSRNRRLRLRHLVRLDRNNISKIQRHFGLIATMPSTSVSTWGPRSMC